MRDYANFFTPTNVAHFMADLLDPKPGEVILEPSAGNGALVKAVKAKCQEAVAFAFEIQEQWEEQLKMFADVVVIKDFLEVPYVARYTKCIANPPFGNGIDLATHFLRIAASVKKGGKIVMIVPEDYDPKVDYKTYDLENWSKNNDGTTTKIKIIEFIQNTF